MIVVVMAIEDGSHPDNRPGSFCLLLDPGEEECAVRTCLAERVLVPVGVSIILRGALVHRGVENACSNVICCRVYAYPTLCDAPMASEHWRDETCPVTGVP